MNENIKKGLVRSISDQFKRTIKVTALTVGLVTPVMLFAQSNGCDTDEDCIDLGWFGGEYNGNPTGWGA